MVESSILDRCDVVLFPCEGRLERIDEEEAAALEQSSRL